MPDNRTAAAGSLFETNRLSDLPYYAKLFVGIFVALMLCVVLWAMWIFYEEKGKIGEDEVPSYSYDADTAVAPDTIRLGQVPQEVQHDLAEIAMDSEAVHSPEWDTEAAGVEEPVDSADIVRIARLAVTGQDTAWNMPATQAEEDSKFRKNLGLAHTHVNGQTLLFFAIGLVFLFTSASVKIKKVVLWVFGVSILAHAIGLTGEGFSWVFDDLLAVSGVVLLVTIVYMAFLIFVDLGKSPHVSD